MIIRSPINNRGFHLMPRQSGKTTLAVKMFLNNPSKNLLVVSSENMKYRVIKNFKIEREYHKNIIHTGTNIGGTIIEGLLIIDDVHFFERDLDEKIRKMIMSLKHPHNILITSTEPQLYNIIKRYVNVKFTDKLSC